MKILVLNCGSSSVKYQVFSIDGDGHQAQSLAGGIVEKIGLESPFLKHKRPGAHDYEMENLPVRDHKDAIKLVLDVISDPEYGVLDSVQDLDAIGHSG